MDIIDVKWPFPQLFRGKRKTLLADKESIYEIDESNYLIKDPLRLYDAYGTTVAQEHLFNGTFTGSATGWTLGTGWAYNSNTIVHTPGNTATAAQASAAMSHVLIDTKLYYVYLYVSGTVGSLYVQIGTSTSGLVLTNGAHVFILPCLGGLNFSLVPSSDFAGSVTTVSITEATGYITAGGPWHFLDLGETWVALNGETVVFTRGAYVYTENSVTINAGCTHRGRVLFGGFDEDNFYNAAWTAYWAANITKASLTMKMKPNTVWWTPIGQGASALHSIFYPTDITTGADPLILDILQQNDGGSIDMSWQGRVWAIKSHIKGAIVYGDSGITYLEPVRGEIDTYGKTELAATGITGRAAVAGGPTDKEGNVLEHLFMNSSGQLCKVDSNLQVKNLGYQEYMQNLLQDPNVVITYNPIDREYYISSGSMCYGLTEKEQLFETQILPTSLITINGAVCGVFDYATDKPNQAIVKTDGFDLGLVGYKKLTWVEVTYEGINDVEVQVEYRNERGAFFIGSRHKLNRHGTCRVNVSAKEFRIAIYGTRLNHARVAGITVKAQVNDKRFVRGIYANQDSA
jgi:hypothetical protein